MYRRALGVQDLRPRHHFFGEMCYSLTSQSSGEGRNDTFDSVTQLCMPRSAWDSGIPNRQSLQQAWDQVNKLQKDSRKANHIKLFFLSCPIQDKTFKLLKYSCWLNLKQTCNQCKLLILFSHLQPQLPLRVLHGAKAIFKYFSC